MKLREIYDRPVDRHINPAVVVKDQKIETINAEIDEYIFTGELLEKLYDFLHTCFNKKVGKTGVWINGYYGSGKSHFIKYAHYCIDPDTRDRAFSHWVNAVEKAELEFSEVTVSNVINLKKTIDKAEPEDIMFNVENVTGDGDRGERLTRVFLRMLNQHRGYNSSHIELALFLEKPLDRKGKLEEFKKILDEEYGFNWEREGSTLATTNLGILLEIAQKVDPSWDIESSRESIINQGGNKINISIEDTLIPELNDYIQSKEKEYRLLFLVDEVSQYIGSNREILLNLQTIVEQVSAECNNQVWIACTAQQKLEEITSGLKHLDEKDEFGKILGRFDTRISLESTDAALITQRRILDKNSSGIKELEEIYKKNTDAIEHQFKMQHDLFKGFQTKDDFLLAYPFVPYQFKLISEVFSSFQNLNYVIREVRDNERSVLSITHYTAKLKAQEDLGYFVPFDAFFNDQFTSNMQHRGTKAIAPALDLTFVKNDPFAQRVVKVLFMISNLAEAVRQTFPANIENLTLLLMDQLDANKKELMDQASKVLDRLIEESVAHEEKGVYSFFKEDEIEVTQEITNLAISAEIRLNEMKDLLFAIHDVRSKFSFNGNDYSLALEVDDRKFQNGNDTKLVFVVYEQRSADEMKMGNPDNELKACVNEWFTKDKKLQTDFIRYCRTSEYLKRNTSTASGRRAETLSSFRTRNSRLADKLKETLVDQIKTTRYISGQTVFDASEIAGGKAPERLKNALEKHFGKLYRHSKLANGYVSTANELRQKVRSDAWQTTMEASLTDAEQMIENEIVNTGNESTIQDLVKKFTAAPFGWRDISIIHMLLELQRKRFRSFSYKNNENFSAKDFVEKAITSSERASCVVKPVKGIPKELRNQAISSFLTIFNQHIPDNSDAEKVAEQMRSAIKNFISEYKPLEEKHYGKRPYGIHFHNVTESLGELIIINDVVKFMKRLTDDEALLKERFEKAKILSGWLPQAEKEYNRWDSFIQSNASNINELGTEDIKKATEASEFFRSDWPCDAFRQVRKACDELDKALKAKKVEERKSVIDGYNEVYSSLEALIAKKVIKEPIAGYVSRETKLEAIKDEENLQALKVLRLDLSNFEGEMKQHIYKAANPGPDMEFIQFDPSSVPTTDLKSKEEVDRYLEDVKKKLYSLIDQKKVVIIK